MNNIEKIWEELFSYWSKHEASCEKCLGAKEEELSKLESSIGFKIPTILKESLRCCNSYPKNLNKVKSCGLYLGNGNMLLDTKSIEEIYLDGIEYGYIDESIIPFFDFNGDVFISISKVDEKIVYSDMEFGIYKTIFDSYEDFLIFVKNEILEKGYFSYRALKI